MKLELIAFTAKGAALAQELVTAIENGGHQGGMTRDGLPLQEWTARAFGRADGLIFIGAAGIAVRAIAPHIKHKSVDPAVVVVDEGGKFVIPILSGHLGGANDLANAIAEILDATPVITTATDVRGVFAVDQWARRQGLFVVNPSKIVDISGNLLGGEEISFFSQWPVAGTMPQGLYCAPQDEAQVVVALESNENALHLSPPISLGIGCRKGIEAEAIEGLFQRILAEEHISPKAICGVFTIDIKGEEPGLLTFCEAHGFFLMTYSAEILALAEGVFTPSQFVKQITGVDNVCERAAAVGGGQIFRKKTKENGVTMALAVMEPELNWRWQG